MNEELCKGCPNQYEGMETCMTDCPLDYCDDCGLNPCECDEINAAYYEDEEWPE